MVNPFSSVLRISEIWAGPSFSGSSRGCCWPACSIRASARPATGEGSAHPAPSRPSAVIASTIGVTAPARRPSSSKRASRRRRSPGAACSPVVARETRVCSYDRAGLAWSEGTSSARSIDALVSELRLLLTNARHSASVCARRTFVRRAHHPRLRARASVQTWPGSCSSIRFIPSEWCDPSPNQRQMLRGGIFLSRLGALLARLGVVRLSLALLSGGAPGAPRQFSRMFGRKAAALMEHMVGEVQKLPPEVLPSVQAHWSNPKAFRGMWQHLAAMPSCSADLTRGTDAFGDIPVVVLSAGARHPQWMAADAALAERFLQGPSHRLASERPLDPSRRSRARHHGDSRRHRVGKQPMSGEFTLMRIRTDPPPCTYPNDRR